MYDLCNTTTILFMKSIIVLTSLPADTPAPSTAGSTKLIIQEELLGNHAHLKHYRHLHPDTMLVNLDVTLQIIAEALLNRSASVGVRIRQIFMEGDTNHDGVLSFSEFVDIVRKVAPEYHDRKILKMFREALMRGKSSYIHLCKALYYQLVTREILNT